MRSIVLILAVPFLLLGCLRGDLDTYEYSGKRDTLDLSATYTRPACADGLPYNSFEMDDNGEFVAHPVYAGEASKDGQGNYYLTFDSKSSEHTIEIYYPQRFRPLISLDYELGEDPSAEDKAFIRVLAGPIGNYYLYSKSGTIHHKVMEEGFEVSLCDIPLYFEDGSEGGSLSLKSE